MLGWLLLVFINFIQKEEGLFGKVGVFMKGSSKSQVSQSKYTEDWLPVRDINNGVIVLDNKYKVTGVKIRPRNIFILDQASQDSVITALTNFYNTLDFEFWLISADRPVDISAYLAQLQLLYNESQNPTIRKMINQDMDKANMFMDNNVTDTEYYILFREKDDNLIQKRIRTLIMGLSNCGLDSSQTSNQDLRVLLDNFLNGGRNFSFRTVTAE